MHRKGWIRRQPKRAPARPDCCFESSAGSDERDGPNSCISRRNGPSTETPALTDEDEQVDYDFAELDELAHAHAVTIHRSQGSEYPAVVIPLTTSSWMTLQRNLLYAGITGPRNPSSSPNPAARTPKPSAPRRRPPPHRTHPSAPPHGIAVVYMSTTAIASTRGTFTPPGELNDVYVAPHNPVGRPPAASRRRRRALARPARAVAGAPNGSRLLRPKPSVSVGLTHHTRGCCFVASAATKLWLPLRSPADQEQQCGRRRARRPTRPGLREGVAERFVGGAGTGRR